MSNRPWTREEVLLAIRLYCKLPYKKLRQTTPEVRELAHLLDRTPSAVSMRCCNYVQFDPVESKRVKGLYQAANLDREIWARINGDWEAFAAECENIEKKIRGDSSESTADSSGDYVPREIPLPLGISKTQVARIRIGQRFFREAVLTAYDHRCCITGIQNDSLLVASHIKPWRDSHPKTERTNPCNGLCLSPLYDKAFDSGMMTVDENCRIVFSSSVLRSSSQEVAQKFFGHYEGKQISLPDRFTPDQQFLEFHRTRIFVQ